jgi:hypothetical protein
MAKLTKTAQKSVRKSLLYGQKPIFRNNMGISPPIWVCAAHVWATWHQNFPVPCHLSSVRWSMCQHTCPVQQLYLPPVCVIPYHVSPYGRATWHLYEHATCHPSSGDTCHLLVGPRSAVQILCHVSCMACQLCLCHMSCCHKPF